MQCKFSPTSIEDLGVRFQESLWAIISLAGKKREDREDYLPIDFQIVVEA